MGFKYSFKKGICIHLFSLQAIYFKKFILCKTFAFLLSLFLTVYVNMKMFNLYVCLVFLPHYLSPEKESLRGKGYKIDTVSSLNELKVQESRQTLNRSSQLWWSLEKGSCVGGAWSCTALWDPWSLAHQVPLSMGFLRQEYWSKLPFPSPRDHPNPGTNLHLLRLLHWQTDSSTTVSPGKPLEKWTRRQLGTRGGLPAVWGQ